MPIDERTEWLETDGRGGFASGTATGVRTRRYHAVLLHALTPPTGRMVLVNGFDAWVDAPDGPVALTSQRYAPGVIHPDGATRLCSFSGDPWPTWEFAIGAGLQIRQELLIEQATGSVCVCWTKLTGGEPVTLRVRPFLSGRDYHALHHRNDAFRFAAERHAATVRFHLYDGVPDVLVSSNGEYQHAPDWYRQFLYDAEHERGLDDTEDLASPGEFSWNLEGVGARAFWLLTAASADDVPTLTASQVHAVGLAAQAAERARRAAFPASVDRAGAAYIVRRRSGKTIVAGYPWFTDWGRDTFIALRGLCLATGRLEDARDILLAWSGAVSEGMLPNRFPDRGESPEFNAVDASLWFVIAARELLQSTRAGEGLVTAAARRQLEAAMITIVNGYAAGTRFGIRMDRDGLLAAGAPGVQLTWMDARVGDRVVTPRAGKPVEVQALWLNALGAVSTLEPQWHDRFLRGRAAFADRFWNEHLGRLADVVDVDHVPGTRDDSFRPNQIFAVGGLPLAVIDGPRARAIVDSVEASLLTPVGLRSLAPTERPYASHYIGDAAARDAAYHQGTVWPWLLGAFVEAWVRVRGSTNSARHAARQRFMPPLMAAIRNGGGHLAEIADAEAPFTWRGCPFQAWSLGEFLRLDRVVLRESSLVRPPVHVTTTRGNS